MEITFHCLDVTPFVTQQPPAKPEAMLKKGLRDQWIVIDGGLVAPATPSMFDVRYGDAVRIPLTSYLTTPDHVRLAGFMAQLGARARDACPADEEIERMHLIVGEPLLETEHQGKPAWRLFLGIAFKIKEKI